MARVLKMCGGWCCRMGGLWVVATESLLTEYGSCVQCSDSPNEAMYKHTTISFGRGPAAYALVQGQPQDKKEPHAKDTVWTTARSQGKTRFLARVSLQVL
eukprot:4797653-Amphidinium_carterae.1